MRKTFSPQRRSGLAENHRDLLHSVCSALSKKLREPLRYLCASAVSFFLLSQFTMAQSPIYVTLWFDTEDYILPQSDDAAKRVAEMLTRLGIKATFKVVGEKARVLEQRGRKDVIAALKKHEIGYHSNYHSMHPTPAEYLQNADWDEGVAEFYRREISGVKDIQRLFGQTPSCYGQPGSSWGPQSYPALQKMGINVYLDEANHVGIDEQPFYYGGMLNIFKMRSNVARMELSGENNLANGKAKFLAAYEKLKAKGGGTISIYYHPCEWVHEEFWDGVNFSRGANPERKDWKLPRVKPQAETEKAFQDFEEYVKFIKAQSSVRYVTANELAEVYKEQSQQQFIKYDDYFQLAKSVQTEISFQKIGGVFLSAAEVFSLLTKTVAVQWEGRLPKTEKPLPLLGPSRSFTQNVSDKKLAVISHRDFVNAVFDVAKYCEIHRRIPSEIKVGASSISPQDYLATLGAFVERLANQNSSLSAPVQIIAGNFTADKYVADDDPKIFNWVIHPEGFHAPKLMALAKLQAWTLKPAVMKK
jgi:hypothetical protein